MRQGILTLMPKLSVSLPGVLAVALALLLSGLAYNAYANHACDVYARSALDDLNSFIRPKYDLAEKIDVYKLRFAGCRHAYGF